MTTPSTTPEPAVLVGLDGSTCSDLALLWALRRAASTGQAVRTVSCWSWPDATLGGTVVVDQAEAASACSSGQVSRALEVTGLEQVKVEQLVVEGLPGPMLVAESARADVLAVGSVGHRMLSTALLGSVSRHCVTHAHCPVVVVKPVHLDLRTPAVQDASQPAHA